MRYFWACITYIPKYRTERIFVDDVCALDESVTTSSRKDIIDSILFKYLPPLNIEDVAIINFSEIPMEEYENWKK